jgi:hypothetical protein
MDRCRCSADTLPYENLFGKTAIDWFRSACGADTFLLPEKPVAKGGRWDGADRKP